MHSQRPTGIPRRAFLGRSAALLALGWSGPFGQAALGDEFFDGVGAAGKPVMEQARKRIEEIRKADFTVRFQAPEGLPSAKASIKLVKHEFGFGANLTSVMLLKEDDPGRAAGLDAIRDLFTLVRIGDNWSLMEPVRGGPLRWDAADRDLAWAKEHGLATRYHTLLYVLENMPKWSVDIKTTEEWWPLIEHRIRAVAERYGDAVPEFEVINEMITQQAWLKTHLPAFPPLSDPHNGARVFAIARRYLPKAILVSLEAGMATTAPENKVFRDIHGYQKALMDLGPSVDAVGYQAHFFAYGKPFQEGTNRGGADAFTMPALARGLDYLATLGRPVHITEFTAPSRSNKVKGPQPGLTAEEVAAWAGNFYTLAFSMPYMKELVCWNVIDNVGGRAMDAGVVARNGAKKPLYHTLRKLLKEDWSTHWQGNLTAEGAASFRGFFGTYQASVEGYTPAQFTLGSTDKGETVVRLEKAP